MAAPPSPVPTALPSLTTQAASLLLYQGVLQNPVGQAFLTLLSTLQSDLSEGSVRAASPLANHAASPLANRAVSPLGNGITSLPENCASLVAYGQWFRALAATGHAWSAYLAQQILQDDNPFSQQAQRTSLADFPPALVAAARQDLAALQAIAHLDLAALSQWVQVRANLATPPIVWQGVNPSPVTSPPANPATVELADRLTDSPTWPDLLPQLVEHYRQQGVGILARSPALRWQSGQLVGIAHPDPVQVRDLVGYDWQQQALLQNTEFLVRGYRALNVLLYGSRGSGKSSLVKSLLQAVGPGASQPFQQRGLRLIEVDKSDLQDLRTIVTQLEGLPQKFILFVDDLSFEEDESAYKSLKVVLEGTLTARPPNVVVYATSNRRHLIREFLGDRPPPRDADEVHAWDTVQEKLSFSDRFGLTLTFPPADQDTYLRIVQHLAQQAGIPLPPAELTDRALQWATRHNGRSGRTARQFIDFLHAELALAEPIAP